MKKILFGLMLVFTFLLSSCNSNPNSGTNQSGDSIESNNISSDSNVPSDNSVSSDNNEVGNKDVVPLYPVETIRSNINSYSHSFNITKSDGISSYEIKFDYETNMGIVIIQNFNLNNEKIDEPTEDFILMDKDYDCVYYNKYEETNSHSYNPDNDLKFFYIRKLFDYSSEIYEGAPYDSKTEMTYAGRQATQYVVSNSDYITAADTKLTIILDNDTGAVLSMAYDNEKFYETTEFTPNNQKAKNDVITIKNTIPFEYFDTRALKIVNLENISFPEGDLVNAGIGFKDASSCQISNLSEYYVGYHYYNVGSTTFITDLCKYVYDQGINCDAGGSQQDFDVLYSEKTVDYGYVKVDIININSYVTINDIKYRVMLQGQSTRNNLNFWYVHLNIYVM